MNLNHADMLKYLDLKRAWQECIEEQYDMRLNFENFRLVAKGTCELFSLAFDLQYLNLQFPIQIVELMLYAKEFATIPADGCNSESKVAQLVANALSDVNNCCGIFHPKKETEPTYWGFKVKGAHKTHKINKDTFRLTKLFEDLY